jgi:predicted phosphate transport protein (TIGR00153 family)
MVRLSLIPQDTRFFDYFERAGENLVEAVHALQDLLENYSDLEAKLARLKQLERTGDDITREVMRALNRTFITPLDREDITQLTRALDDVLDKAWAAAARLQLYAISEPTETARQLAAILVKMTEALQRALPLLRTRHEMQRIIPITEELDHLETEADDQLRAGLGRLFQGVTDVEQVVLSVKWREIYDFLEEATDTAEDAADVLEAIVLKHG